jgi:hypothetical protein
MLNFKAKRMVNMKIQRGPAIHIFIFVLGLILFSVGFATSTSGAWIIGLVVMAVNLPGFNGEGRQME